MLQMIFQMFSSDGESISRAGKFIHKCKLTSATSTAVLFFLNSNGMQISSQWSADSSSFVVFLLVGVWVDTGTLALTGFLPLAFSGTRILSLALAFSVFSGTRILFLSLSRPYPSGRVRLPRSANGAFEGLSTNSRA